MYVVIHNITKKNVRVDKTITVNIFRAGFISSSSLVGTQLSLLQTQLGERVDRTHIRQFFLSNRNSMQGSFF